MITGNEGDLFEAEDRFGWRVSGHNSQLPKLRTVAGSKAGRTEKRRSLVGICSTKFAGSYAKKALALAISAGVVYCAEPSTKARTVLVHSQDVVPISVSVGFSTLVVLPKGEEIMSAFCGKKKIWAIDWERNYAFIKQGVDTPGEKTNANLVTASGNVYSLMITDVSKSATAVADLRVILDQGDETAVTHMEHPTFVRADSVNELKESLKRKEEELEDVKKNAVLEAVRDQKHDYEWKQGKESAAFGLRAIYHDKLFTYVELDSQTAPAIYEQIDGKDSIVQYSLKDGKYVITHVMDDGTFRAGKTKLEFKRKKG